MRFGAQSGIYETRWNCPALRLIARKPRIMLHAGYGVALTYVHGLSRYVRYGDERTGHAKSKPVCTFFGRPRTSIVQAKEVRSIQPASTTDDPLTRVARCPCGPICGRALVAVV